MENIFSVLCSVYFPLCAAEIYFPLYANEILKGSIIFLLIVKRYLICLMHTEQWHIYNGTLSNIFQRPGVVSGRVFRKNFSTGVWALEKVIFRVVSGL